MGDTPCTTGNLTRGPEARNTAERPDLGRSAVCFVRARRILLTAIVAHAILAAYTALVILGARGAFAQDYRLILQPQWHQTTAIDATASYGHSAYVPGSMTAWRHRWADLYVPTGWPAIVLDAAEGIAVGFSSGFPNRRDMAGHVWLPDGSVLNVKQGEWLHACVVGTNGTMLVGRLSGHPQYDAPMAAYWTWDRQWHLIHPVSGSGWWASVAEDVSPLGVIVGWGTPDRDIDRAVIWTNAGSDAASILPSPAWADVQTRAVGVSDAGYIVGDATGAVTRPIVWGLDGQPVNLAYTFGFAWDVNSAGLAVGWLQDGGAPDRAWISVIDADPRERFELHRGLSSVGVLWALPDLTPIDLNRWGIPGVRIVAAYAVSERGDIAVECEVGGESVGGVLVRKDADNSQGGERR